MKMKLKLDKTAVLKLLEEHVEKLVLAVFLLLTAGGVLGAFMKRDQMDKRPEQLQDEVKRARANLSKGKPVQLKERDYASDAKVSWDPIIESPYHCGTLWTPYLAQKLDLRGAPELLIVKGLRGAGEFGSIRMAQAADQAPGEGTEGPMGGGTENIEGKWWITITGVVPFKDQNLAYQKVFQNAINEANAPADVPDYVGFQVERVDAPLSGNTKDLDWTKSIKFNYTINDGPKILEGWAMSGSAPDVVPDQCVNGALTYPLAPLADQEWGEPAAHEPEIPYNPAAQYGMTPPAEGPAPEGKADAKKGKTAEDPNAIFRPEEGTQPGNAPVTGPGRVPGPAAPGGLGTGRIMPPGMGGHGFMPPGMAGHGIKPPGTGRAPFAPAAQPLDTNWDYYLLRYCDFKVEPGKRYIYRVRVVLKNPNFKKKENYLKSKDLAKAEFLFSNWSDQTEPIAVPLDTRVLVKTTKPNADVFLVKWKKSTGTKVFYEDKNVERGRVLNYQKVEVTPVPGQSGYNPIPTEGQKKEKEDFTSDTLVLDISGGEKLPGKEKMTVPGQILVMDAHGGILIRKEVSDWKDVTLLTGGPTAPGGGIMPGPGGLRPPFPLGPRPGGAPGYGPMGPMPMPHGGGGTPRSPYGEGPGARGQNLGGQRNPRHE
jgi:hypothetical protein